MKVESCFAPSHLGIQAANLSMHVRVRAALHLEARPIPLEADCMKFKPSLGGRLASTTHYDKIVTGADFPICKGIRAKKLGRFNKSSIIYHRAV